MENQESLIFVIMLTLFFACGIIGYIIGSPKEYTRQEFYKCLEKTQQDKDYCWDKIVN